MEEITKQKLIIRDKTIERLKTELDEVNKLNAIFEKQLKEYEKKLKKKKINKELEKDGSFEELEEDIGLFTKNGSYILKNLEEDYSMTYINTIIQQNNGDINARYIYHSKKAISQKQCLKLINHINHNDNNDLIDYKLNIDDNKLKELIGEKSYEEIIKLFDGEHNTIYIRKVKGDNSMIDFHKDYSTKTLKIPLNKDSDYKGGDLIYLTNGKINKPEQKIGSMTIHTNDIIHGVSPIISGIRYSLFVLYTPNHIDQKLY